MYSHTSLLQAMPPSPTLRKVTSAPISNVMARSSTHARNINTSSRRPKMRDMPSMVSPPRVTRSLWLRKELPQLWTVLWTLLNDARPRRVVGFRQIGFRVSSLELDCLYADLLHPLDIRIVC